ncbi:uncharacterized protein LOC130193837 isoform X4 [Pseudoliparis swirei]|uniref:uncharacterized protein LOC130193837 isoform X4 n=1 Tax=Pseudoliparis swirei TaxID=2059687 RepID=UPI0024BDD99A|nr:uncharacterized protein LOC130193837 isoform X4 [Pseudoliparis swirei]
MYPVKAFLGRLRALRVQVNNPAEERAQRPGGGGRSQSEGKDPDGRRLQISGEDPDVRKFTEEEMAVHRAHVEACQPAPQWILGEPSPPSSSSSALALGSDSQPGCHSGRPTNDDST